MGRNLVAVSWRNGGILDYVTKLIIYTPVINYYEHFCKKLIDAFAEIDFGGSTASQEM